jgi:hypothetical protein
VILTLDQYEDHADVYFTSSAHIPVPSMLIASLLLLLSHPAVVMLIGEASETGRRSGTGNVKFQASGA